MINRRDLRNQIQERDEQISNDSFSNDQIEANLSSALAPFQISEDMQTKHTKKHRKQNKKHRANNIDSRLE